MKCNIRTQIYKMNMHIQVYKINIIGNSMNTQNYDTLILKIV